MRDKLRTASRWLLRHPVLVVACAAAACRLSLIGVPLIITNDGVGYLSIGTEIAAGAAPSIPPSRTPGYPAFLAALFILLGVGPIPVLIGQHLLGVATSMVVAQSVHRRHGPRWSILTGLAAGLLPGLLVWEFYILTESLAVGAIISAMAVALIPGGRRRALALGLLLGAGCLVRPAVQVVVPFAAVGWWIMSGRGSARAAALAAGFTVMVGPWVAFNASRGIPGVAGGGGISVWMGFAHAGLLSEPAPEPVRDEYQRLRGGPVTDSQVHKFLNEANAWSDPEKQRLLSRWAWNSAAARPGAYMLAVWSTLGSQLELRSRLQTDSGWFLWRLSQDGTAFGQGAPNFQVSGQHSELTRMAMPLSESGAARAGFLARVRIRGLPQVALFAAAGVAVLAALKHRRWGTAVVILGTLAYAAAHVAMLQPWSRLCVPAWACWLLVAPDSVDALRRRAGIAGRSTPGCC